MAITGPNTVAFTTHHLGITSSAPTNSTASATTAIGTNTNAIYNASSSSAALNTLAASTPSAYPVITSHKTGTTNRNRKKPGNHTALFGLSGGQAPNISANQADGKQGTDQVRAGLRIGNRPKTDHGNVGKPPPTARYVMGNHDSCDRFDGAKKKDVLDKNFTGPTKGTRTQAEYDRATADYKNCKRAALFVQQAMNAQLPVYITLEPDPGGTERNRPGHAHSARQYVRSVARLWHYSVFQNVRVWGATNEPEHNNKLSSNYAAEIWKQMQAAARDNRRCDKCTIVAGEFNGDTTRQAPFHNTTDPYIGSYMKYLKDRGANPKVWALHDYYDVVIKDTSTFTPRDPKSPKPSKQYAQARYFARKVHDFNNQDRVWLSEQGVLLIGSGADLANTNAKGAASRKQQDAAKRFMALAMQAPNIDLVNYYSFFGAGAPTDVNKHPFDSALVRPPDIPAPDKPPPAAPTYTFGAFRPAYCVLTKQPQSSCYQGTGRYPGDGNP